MMADLQAVVDRVQIEALRGEFADAAMTHDYDRLASLFTEDGAVRMPHIKAEALGREEIRAAARRLQDLWHYFVQTTHPGSVQLDGDVASGRTYVSEFGQLRDGSSHLNYAVYHDLYQRTPKGWKFSERVYEIKYLNTTPMGGAPPEGGQLPITGHEALHKEVANRAGPR